MLSLPRAASARPPAPRARFDQHGDLYIDWYRDLAHDPALACLEHHLAHGLPPGEYDWEDADHPSTLWVAWPYALRIMSVVQVLWPETRTEAESNEWFGKVDQLAERLHEALRAINAAECIVRRAPEVVA